MQHTSEVYCIFLDLVTQLIFEPVILRPIMKRLNDSKIHCMPVD